MLINRALFISIQDHRLYETLTVYSPFSAYSQPEIPQKISDPLPEKKQTSIKVSTSIST